MLDLWLQRVATTCADVVSGLLYRAPMLSQACCTMRRCCFRLAVPCTDVVLGLIHHALMWFQACCAMRRYCLRLAAPSADVVSHWPRRLFVAFSHFRLISQRIIPVRNHILLFSTEHLWTSLDQGQSLHGIRNSASLLQLLKSVHGNCIAWRSERH